MHDARHRNPCAYLAGPVACLRQFVVWHIDQIAPFPVLQLLEIPTAEFLVETTGRRLAVKL